MIGWLLSAAETLASALQKALPPSWRGLTRVSPGQAPRKGQAAQLVLPPEGMLEQRFDKPAVVTPDWVEARVEAISPWEKSACLWDWKVDDNAVRLAVAPLRAVQEAEALAGPLAEVVSGPFRFRRDLAQLRRWRDRIALGAGLGVLVALGLAFVAVQLAAQASERAAVAEAALERSTARLKEGAGPAEAAMALLSRKADSVGLGLAKLAAALPVDSYLTTLSVSQDGFEISGQTTKPEGIIPALTGAGFAAVDFAGPTAHDAASGRYSFTIRGKLGTP